MPALGLPILRRCRVRAQLRAAEVRDILGGFLGEVSGQAFLAVLADGSVVLATECPGQ